MPKLPMRMPNPALPCLLAAAIGAPAAAQVAEDRIMDCAVIVASEERLACFDEIATGLGAAAARQVETRRAEEAEAARLAAERETAAAEQRAEFTAEQAFGREKFAPGEGAAGQSLDEIAARIVRADEIAYGKWMVYLDNGHVWRTDQRMRTRPRVDKDVVIKRGFGGSYRLVLGNQSTQASRVR